MSTDTGSKARSEGVLHQSKVLGAFTLVAGVLLVGANLATHGAIDQRIKEDTKASVSQVLPDGMHDNDLLANPLTLTNQDGKEITVYQAIKNGQVTGVAYPITGNGYSGDINLILGVDPQGRILGARVLSHTETPGLGDKIELAKTNWILAFNGKSMGEPPRSHWKVKKDGGDFDQFSGATITPRGVVGAVVKGLDFFAGNRDALLSPPATDTAAEQTPEAH